MNQQSELCDNCHIRIRKNIDKEYLIYKVDSPEEIIWCEECYTYWIKKAVECGWMCDAYKKPTPTN